MKKNTAGQKWVVFAFDETDNTPKTGDAAQITAKVSKDGAAAGATTDANPTELESGYYAFDIDADETNGNYLAIIPVSSTGNIQVVGVPGGVWTTFPVESVDSGATQIARVGADGDTLEDLSDEIAAVKAETVLIVEDTGTTLPARFTGIEGATFATGTDSLEAIRDDRTLPAADYTVVGDTIARVTLVDTATTVTGGAIESKQNTAQSDLDIITGTSGVLIDTDAVDADAIKTDAVDLIWANAMSDLAQGAPSATASVLTAINYLYESWRNKTTTTATLITVMKDDGSTGLVKSTISDDGTTFTKGEFITGA